MRHRCIDMWSLTEMLFLSCREQRMYEFRLAWVQKYVPIWILTICRKTFPPKTTKMLSTRNSSMLTSMSSLVNLLFESEFGASLTSFVFCYNESPTRTWREKCWVIVDHVGFTWLISVTERISTCGIHTIMYLHWYVYVLYSVNKGYVDKTVGLIGHEEGLFKHYVLFIGNIKQSKVTSIGWLNKRKHIFILIIHYISKDDE